MLNRKYFPFERNNYYFGKLLTAKDFESEQRYFNDKRRLINRLTGANGIVSGLGVIAADDVSIILQAGCAFDASGREIVVPETKVIKLSTIEGFSQLSTSTALLGLSYDEQPSDEVYAAMASENADIRFNKVMERFKLTLLDENLTVKLPDSVAEFVGRQLVYQDPDVEVVQITPTYVVKDRCINISVQITRLSAGSGEYSMLYQLEIPGFITANGGSIQEVEFNRIKLSKGESYTLEYIMTPEEYVFGGSVVATISEFVLKKNDEAYNIKQSIRIPIKPSPMKLNELYFKNYYNRSMDKVLTDSYDEHLWIAKIELLRQSDAVIIDRILPPPFEQYSYNANQMYCLNRLEEYYPQKSGGAKLVTSEETTRSSVRVAADAQHEQCEYATGVFDFPLGLGYSQKAPMLSDEIMHGLGKGSVNINVGIEYITSTQSGETAGELLLGDASLFSEGGVDDRIYNISLGVKVLLERGTFIVGLRAGESSGLISIRIRWFATKIPEAVSSAASENKAERMIIANPDTIVVQPKGTVHITPVFINMPGEVCAYKVLDQEGGSVDNNGLYTAPAKEGVYEIRIEALSDPTVYTHVFAVVSTKKKEQ